MAAETHYQKPGWFTRNVFNRLVALFTRAGVSVMGSRVLEVPGRKSGQPRQTPVNLLSFEGREYVVSPRGTTEWVRNVRAAGSADLLLGNRRQHRVAVELPDAEKVPVLRAYLRRWKMEVGVFFDGVTDTSTDEQILAAAGRHPVFRLDAGTA